jgi:transcription antitermination factor NusG
LLDWFAIYVQSRHEKVAAQGLIAKGFETCLPLSRPVRTPTARRATVEVPVFPGYVFCKFDSAQRAPILRTIGIVRIISFGKELVPIGSDEVSALKVLERSHAPVEEWPLLERGQRVRIEDGPLEGLVGIVSGSKSGLRVVVSVALLQRSVAVEVNRAHLRPLESNSEDREIRVMNADWQGNWPLGKLLPTVRTEG